MRDVVASAPGKVNLLLRCGAPTPDGYHPLVTVFEALDVRETVRVRTSRTPGVRVRTLVHRPDGSVDEAASRALDEMPSDVHLAGRAARLLQRLAAAGPWAHTAAGVELTVDKHIPVAGGMAGGSADAAAALVACDELWGLHLGLERLEELGRTLGADVPACLRGGTTLGVGRGDHLRSVEPADGAEVASHHWVMCVSGRGLSTPEVFRHTDALGGPGGTWHELTEPSTDDLAHFLRPASELAAHLANDLTHAALDLRPDLARTMTAAEDAGALAVLLSGSGPTVAALAADADHAAGVARALAGVDGVAHVVRTCGPAEGARIESVEGTH